MWPLFAMPNIDPAQDMRLVLDEVGLRSATPMFRAGGRHSKGVDRPPGAQRERRCARAALRVGPETRRERVGSGGTLQFFADERAEELRSFSPAPVSPSCDPRSRWSARSGALVPPVWPAGITLRPV